MRSSSKGQYAETPANTGTDEKLVPPLVARDWHAGPDQGSETVARASRNARDLH
jgi:hypothetical protein